MGLPTVFTKHCLNCFKTKRNLCRLVAPASQQVGIVFWFLQISLVESKDVVTDRKHNIQLENILFTVCNSWTEAITFLYLWKLQILSMSL